MAYRDKLRAIDAAFGHGPVDTAGYAHHRRQPIDGYRIENIIYNSRPDFCHVNLMFPMG